MQNKVKVDQYLNILKNYSGFDDRARRREYRMLVLVDITFTFVLGTLDGMFGWERVGGEGTLATIYGVLVLIPWWAIQFRHLHDTDRSAWWLLVLLIPIVGWLATIIFNCQGETQGSNRFGPDPKQLS